MMKILIVLVLLISSVGLSNAVLVTPGNSIQEAIESLPDGGIIELEVGTHNISEYMVNLSSNIHIIGNSANKSEIIIEASIDRSNASLLQETASTDGGRVGFYVNNVTNVSFKNFTLYPTVGTNSVGKNAGLYFFNVSNSSIDNIEIYGTGGAFGHTFQNAITFEDRIKNVFMGSQMNNYNNSITNVYLHENCVNLFFGSYKNGTICNNIISKSLSGFGIYLQSGSNYNVIDSNTINDSANGAIQIYSNSNNNIFTNNTVYDNQYGVLIQGGSNNIVQYNTVYDNIIGGGILLKMPYESTSNIIKNNILYNNLPVGIGSSAGDPFSDSGFDSVNTIESNTIVSSQIGIYLNHTNQIYITSNNIIELCDFSLNDSNKDSSNIISIYNLINSTDTDYSGNVTNKTGDITTITPLFFDMSLFNFHLNSTIGVWNGTGWEITLDSSPAIDTGNPSSDYSNEPSPNGDRINMGAYGNTLEASKNPWVQDNSLYVGVETKTYSNGNMEYGRAITQSDDSLNNIFSMVVI